MRDDQGCDHFGYLSGSVDFSQGGDLAEKEYRARIWVKLTDDMLPQPLLSKAELEAHLKEVMGAGLADSPIVSIVVEDPRTDSRPRRY